MALEITKKQVAAIAKGMNVPGASYLQKIDLIAKAMGFTNQATLMASFEAKDGADRRGDKSPEEDFPVIHDRLSEIDKASMGPYVNDLKGMSVRTLTEENRRASDAADAAESWMEAISAHKRAVSGADLSAADKAAISEHANDLKAFSLAELDGEFEQADREYEDNAPWAAATGARLRDLRAQREAGKPFRAIIAFGETMSSVVSEGGKIGPDTDGDLHEVSFETQAELSAYLQGVSDGDGWMDYTVAASLSDGSAGNDENPEYFEALKDDPNLRFSEWHNENRADREDYNLDI